MHQTVARVAVVPLALVVHAPVPRIELSPITLAPANDRPWRLIVSLEFASERSALNFERYLKSGSGRGFAKRHFV